MTNDEIVAELVRRQGFVVAGSMQEHSPGDTPPWIVDLSIETRVRIVAPATREQYLSQVALIESFAPDVQRLGVDWPYFYFVEGD